jgi:hypothetical protein
MSPHGKTSRRIGKNKPSKFAPPQKRLRSAGRASRTPRED